MNHRAFAWPVALVAAVSWASVACDASSPPPQPAAPSYAAAPPPAAPPAVPAAGASGTARPGQASAFAPLGVAPNNGSAPPIDPTLAGAAAAILDKVAGNLAPGASREGAPMAATFQTGQTMEQIIQLATGRCYTVVAAGPTVQAWDFSLILVANPLPCSRCSSTRRRPARPRPCPAAATASSGRGRP